MKETKGDETEKERRLGKRKGKIEKLRERERDERERLRDEEILQALAYTLSPSLSSSHFRTCPNNVLT